MRKINIFYYVLTAITAITVSSCKKNIPGRTDNLAPLNPQNIDLNAGTWKPVLMSRPDTFSVPAPVATTSAEYLAELDELKGYQKNMTGEQVEKMKYWSAGNVLRWNEIMRDLVTKYNIPAYQNPDGSYPIPSAANPFAYPLFPFANPPYAARAYAYISAAQYDALIACWYYKKLYNRPQPYSVDPTVKAQTGSTTLPSYPSEAAVVAGVTAEMMKLLFPDEISYVQQNLYEAETSAMISGTATRSDITAGEALGRQVAQQFIARAKVDNAGKAVGTPTDWANLETKTIAKGEVPWYSLEIPKRPPMLPLFGKITPFLFDTTTVAALRPGPPPATHSDQMRQETQEVYNYVKNPSREHIRIVHFWADGISTYTPPGHWNAIASEDFIPKNFSEVRWARNMALLNMSLMDAAIVCWDTKYFYYNARPTQLDSDIKTLTGVPNFPSYISGHSTFSGAAATILGHIIPEKAGSYTAMANEASLSRLVGGLHYRSDCNVGLLVGASVGNYAVARAKTDGAE
ncbi:MAG: vanadium-dependent haloperoxidase [Bacteroidota bacterium]|nr:vanadium-dependent haloperoxidase [Bacteroidota bacterium]